MRKLASKRRVKARFMIGRWVSDFDMRRCGLSAWPVPAEVDWVRYMIRRKRTAMGETE